MASFDNNETEEKKFDPNSEGDGTNGQPSNSEGDQNFTIEYNGRKMTRDEVLTKLKNADDHISTLEGERQQDRERLDKLLEKAEQSEQERKETNELLERLGHERGKPDADDKDRKTVNEDQLAERAANAAYDRMNRERQEEQKKENQKQVRDVLYDRYGEKIDENVFTITRELGYSDEEAFELAGSRPKAFLRMVGVEDKRAGAGKKSTSTSTRNPPENSEQNADTPPKVHGAKTSKERMAAWESRLQSRLRELGIDN